MYFFFSEWTYSVNAVEGNLVELPCNASTTKTGDEVKLVLWFKNGSNKPIYTYVILDCNCLSIATSFLNRYRKNAAFYIKVCFL